MNERRPLYVLNQFLKFEKKLYRFNDIKLSKPIPLKSLLYFMSSGAVYALIVVLPGIGTILRMMPTLYLLMSLMIVPTIITHLLVGMGSENRPPISSFKAFVSYQWFKIKGYSYYKGNIIERPKTIAFKNESTIQFGESTRGQQNEAFDELSCETHRTESDIQSEQNSLGVVRN